MLNLVGAKQLDITYPVADFKRQCQDWQQYNSELNSIRIVHTRKYVYLHPKQLSGGIQLTRRTATICLRIYSSRARLAPPK